MKLADVLREVSAVQASVEGPSKQGRVPQPQSVQTGLSQSVGDGQEGGQQSLVLLSRSSHSTPELGGMTFAEDDTGR